MSDLNDLNDLDALYAELGELAAPEKKKGLSTQEERIMAGFEEIQRFVEQQQRLPQAGDDRDIFERLYAVRLARLQALEDCHALLAPLDTQGLLSASNANNTPNATETADTAALDEAALLDELTELGAGELTDLHYVRSSAEKRSSPEAVAERAICTDFAKFAPLFKQVEAELKADVRQTRRFVKDASIEQGQFFILNGQMVYVAEVGEPIKNAVGEKDARLRVIYANQTESNLLLRSLRRALYKDKAGRRITDPEAGPLFNQDVAESGTIYVLRSLSSDPFIAANREWLHKIGVTGGKVEQRIANAAHDATYLLAEVEVVATYQLSGINRTKLERLLHRVFAPAQIDAVIYDRFGHPVKPREWFLVPLAAIDAAVQAVQDGSIVNKIYDETQACLVDSNT